MQCFIILQYLSLNKQLYNYITYSYVASYIYRNIIISVDYQNKDTDMHGIYVAIAIFIFIVDAVL